MPQGASADAPRARSSQRVRGLGVLGSVVFLLESLLSCCPSSSQHSALEALEALDYHTEHLFLHFVMEHLEDEPGTSKEQVIQTLSFISLLFNLSWVVRSGFCPFSVPF